MGGAFGGGKPLLTVMLQCETPEVAVSRIEKSLPLGADAFGLQVECLRPEYRNGETVKRIFDAGQGKPFYVTNYRYSHNEGKSDDELADGLIQLADRGAALVDVMGDLFCRHPDELTGDERAIKRQTALIDAIHARGAQVLMSSHLYRYAPAERVLEIAFEQKRRGADVIKIVTAADDMAQQIENLRITDLLRRELGAPFLFLTGGTCSVHRRLGMKLGCCMGLCVYEHDKMSTPAQPLLTVLKTVRDELGF